MFDREIFDETRKEFLSHLRYSRGHSPSTCYSYHSDLGIWAGWLIEAGKDWRRVKAQDVEQFAAWQLREKGVSAHIAVDDLARNTHRSFRGLLVHVFARLAAAMFLLNARPQSA